MGLQTVLVSCNNKNGPTFSNMTCDNKLHDPKLFTQIVEGDGTFFAL